MAGPSYLRQVPPPMQGVEGESEVDIANEGVEIDPKAELLRVEYPDGSVSINLGGLISGPRGESSEHTANLAEHVDALDLSLIADELLRLIEDDESRQERRLNDISKGMDLLGIKLEEPRAEPSEEGMSVVRHPLLLEAVMRFQANARGELLPADGPVKMRDDGEGTIAQDDEANKLAKDMNHYLTTVATEYYPDMDRMLFSLGFGGEAYKKVYNDPLKRRPVAQTIDRKDLILADGAVSLESCTRVTHRTRLPPSLVRRMMLIGAWRDVELTTSPLGNRSEVDEKLDELSGVAPRTSLDLDNTDRTIYECYCELDLPGFEHVEDGEQTGLQLPYRVTIEKDTRQVLEIRRWWREEDETFTRKEVFVEYVFVPAFPGVNLGLLHILGNAARALTGAWRIALDNGMLSNFPGGVIARSSGRQQSTNIRVAPGQLAQIDTDGGPLNQAFQPLPYRDVTPGFMGLVSEITQTAQRVGGTAETETGEGRSDAPVGTTIALIEQATKVLSAVHKRLHQAQAKELGMLKELFYEDPEALWRKNKTPALPKERDAVIRALQNSDIVPASDPNTSSQALRIQKAQAVKQAAMAAPMLYDMLAVERRYLAMLGVGDIEELMAKALPTPPQQDPTAMIIANAEALKAQAKAKEVELKAQTAAQDAEIKAAQTQIKAQEAETKAAQVEIEAQNRAADRSSKIRVEELRLQREAMDSADRLDHERGVHRDTMGLESAKLMHQSDTAREQADLTREQNASKSVERKGRAMGGRVVADEQAPVLEALKRIVESVAGPKEIVRDPVTNRITGVRPAKESSSKTDEERNVENGDGSVTIKLDGDK